MSNSRRKRNNHPSSQVQPMVQRAQKNSSVPALPPGAAYRPIPSASLPVSQGYGNNHYGVSYQGNYPGQNLQGDNSVPVQAYGPQYALVPIDALQGLVTNGQQGQQNQPSPTSMDNLPVVPRPLGPRQAPMFPPGDPIRPIPNLLPRQYPYPVGVNISTALRATELVDFPTLRNLSRLYEGITLCKNAIFRIFRRTELDILPRPEYLSPDEDPTDDKWLTPALQMKEWFLEGPEKRGQDLVSWMVKAMTDLLEIDALGIYPVPTRSGGLFALELIAGDTIVPLQDESGRIPYAPRPAYRQILYGAPGPLFMQASGQLNGLELDYLLLNGQTDSPYGVSPVQDVLLKINTALRKGEYDLQRYTSGSTPEGVIETQNQELVGKMTPDQVLTWQDMWNGVLAGNSAMRVKTPFVPPGFHFAPTRPQDVQTDFDRYCLNVTVARLGLTLDEIGFTETSNRATGSAQEAVVYRNAVLPYTNFVGGYFTRGVIARYDGMPLSATNATISRPGSPAKSAKGVWDKRFYAAWRGVEEPDDFNRRVSAHVQLVKAGIEGPTKALRQLGIKPDPGEGIIPAFIAVQGGPQSIAFIDDLVAQRDKMNDANSAALDAKIASSKQVVDAMNNPQAAMPGQPGAPNPIAAQAVAAGKPQQAQQAASGGKPPQVQQQVAQKGAALQAKAQRFDDIEGDTTVENPIRFVPQRPVHGLADAQPQPTGRREFSRDGSNRTWIADYQRHTTEARAANSAGGASGNGNRRSESGSTFSSEEISAEWRRYRERALKAIKQGRQVAFISNVLPQPLYGWVSDRLETATTADDVRAIFAEAKLREERQEASEPPEAHTGIMVAFFLDPEAAKQLALPGGEPAVELHITLAFLGDKSQYSSADLRQLRRELAGWASEQPRLHGQVTGVGTFPPSPSSDGKTPLFAQPDIAGILAWRASLVKMLDGAGFPVDKTFPDYHPHITLAYLDAGEQVLAAEVPHVSLSFDRLWLAVGDERWSTPIGDDGDEQYPERRQQPIISAPQDDPIQRLADAMVQRIQATANVQVADALRENRTLVLQAISE